MRTCRAPLLGPVDYLVVEFPAEKANFSGEMAAELGSLVVRELVRVRPAVRDAGERHVIAEVIAELIGRGSGTPVTQQFWMLATMDSSKIARSEAFASEVLALEAMGLRE